MITIPVAQSALIVSDDVDGNGDNSALTGTITAAWVGWNGTLPNGTFDTSDLLPLADDVDAGFADSLLTRISDTAPTPFTNQSLSPSVTYGGAIAAGTYTINLQVVDYNNAPFPTVSFDFAGLTASSSSTATPASGDDAIWSFTYEVALGDASIGNDLDLAFSATGTGNYGVDHVEIDFVAVPEPSSTALLGLGGLALTLRRRK